MYIKVNMNIKDLTVDNSVFISKGEASGKTLAVFCGVHGNEKS
jgi:predicted deacylase